MNRRLGLGLLGIGAALGIGFVAIQGGTTPIGTASELAAWPQGRADSPLCVYGRIADGGIGCVALAGTQDGGDYGFGGGATGGGGSQWIDAGAGSIQFFGSASPSSTPTVHFESDGRATFTSNTNTQLLQLAPDGTVTAPGTTQLHSATVSNNFTIQGDYSLINYTGGLEGVQRGGGTLSGGSLAVSLVTFGSIPFCVCSETVATPTPCNATSISTTGFTAKGTGSDTFDWICVGDK